MNEVSIIINGVRYDAVEDTLYSYSSNCDLYDQISGCQPCLIGIHVCARLIGVDGIFKKSDKSLRTKSKVVITNETKYNIGQEVWFLFDGKPLNGKIARISEYTIKVKVIFKDGKEYLFSRDIKDFRLFPTKEELLKSL